MPLSIGSHSLLSLPFIVLVPKHAFWMITSVTKPTSQFSCWPDLYLDWLYLTMSTWCWRRRNWAHSGPQDGWDGSSTGEYGPRSQTCLTQSTCSIFLSFSYLSSPYLFTSLRNKRLRRRKFSLTRILNIQRVARPNLSIKLSSDTWWCSFLVSFCAVYSAYSWCILL